ncbi:MAG: hypothetical protein EOO73_31825 [Myxococcales bacterium]|nr:MAG: hypothetical protein EOO73_31825 [Myxococcales bacterium]
MPTPVGVNASPVTIPPVESEGDAAPAAGRASSPPISIPPVYIEGQAESAERLVKAHDAAKAARSCVSEGVTAAYGALEVAGAVGGMVLGTALAGPLGVALGLAAVSGVSYSEGQKLRALSDCLKE